MIRVTHVQPEGGVLVQGGPELLGAEGLKWIDVEGATPEELSLLQGKFGLHKLAIEDCLHLDQRPKLEEYPNHLFIVVQNFSCEKEDLCDLTLHELHFFLGDSWVISVHETPSEAVSKAREKITQDPSATIGRGADFVVYLVADALVDQAFPILDRLNDELEDLEVKIFDKPAPAHLQRIFDLKRMMVHFRRVLSPQRDVVNLLSRRGLPHINERSTLYFRNIYDHLVRIYESIDASRDLLGNAMDGYLNMTAQKTNEITKQLTIFATIFLPLSFIVGFFGQNFDVLSGPGFFWAMWGSILALPTGLMFWFRKRRWI